MLRAKLAVKRSTLLRPGGSYKYLKANKYIVKQGTFVAPASRCSDELAETLGVSFSHGVSTPGVSGKTVDLTV
eukprot:2240137-Alexandrium_andersonii.AAC.1